MAQFARPISDDSVGNWSDAGSAEVDGYLWNSIDEETQDGDTSYIVSSTGTDYSRVKIGTVTDPAVSTGHVLHAWFRSIGSGTPERLTVQLMEGFTLICSVANNSNRADTYLDIAYTLAAEEADAITDYSTLYIRFLNQNAASPEEMRVTMACLEVPDAGQTFYQSCGGSLTGQGAILKKASIFPAGSLTPAGAILRKVSIFLAGSLAPSGHAYKKMFESLAGSITGSGALQAAIKFTQACVGSITGSGTLSKKVGKFVGGSVSAAGELLRKTSKVVGGSIGPIGALGTVITIKKAMAGSVTAVGTLIAQKLAEAMARLRMLLGVGE